MCVASLNASQLGVSRALVPGHKSHGRKGIFVWPRCCLDKVPSHPVQAHSLCMSITFKIMSFLSKGLPEGPFSGFVWGVGGGAVGRQRFQGLDKA